MSDHVITFVVSPTRNRNMKWSVCGTFCFSGMEIADFWFKSNAADLAKRLNEFRDHFTDRNVIEAATVYAETMKNNLAFKNAGVAMAGGLFDH